jgi:hypothetical protein
MDNFHIDKTYPVLAGLALALARELVQNPRSWLLWFRNMTVAAICAVVTWYYTMDWQVAEWQKQIIIGMSAMAGRDLIEGLVRMILLFKENPVQFITDIKSGKLPRK